MKAFTNIEQSRKLAEILPPESADMCWVTDEIEPLWGVVKSEPDDDFDVIPCWSLFSLLNYLREIDFFPEIDADEFAVTMNINYYDEEDGSLLAPIHNIKVKAESFIDACVEMIEKLHEQKVL